MNPERPGPQRTALVTGANRGIGLEVCRQLAARGLRVVLTGREAGAAHDAADDLRARGLEVLEEALDVRDPGAALALAARLAQRGVHVDALVNNAGVYPQGCLLDMPRGELVETLETNFLGALWTARAFVPAMLDAGYGRVVNVSSGYGSVGEGLAGPGAYSLSKGALGALTIKLAQEVPAGTDVKVNAADPGWVRTRMGGPAAARSVEKGAETIVWLATLPADGPNGIFFRDRKPIAW